MLVWKRNDCIFYIDLILKWRKIRENTKQKGKRRTRERRENRETERVFDENRDRGRKWGEEKKYLKILK